MVPMSVMLRKPIGFENLVLNAYYFVEVYDYWISFDIAWNDSFDKMDALKCLAAAQSYINLTECERLGKIKIYIIKCQSL